MELVWERKMVSKAIANGSNCPQEPDAVNYDAKAVVEYLRRSRLIVLSPMVAGIRISL